VCSARLPRNGFISIDSTDYGVFERWILRLGYFTARRSYPEVLEGDMVVFLEPSQPISAEYRAELVRFVERGGRMLVVDSPPGARRRYRPPVEVADDDDAGDSAPTASAASAAQNATNLLLEPFEIFVDHAAAVGGAGKTLDSSEGWPSVPVKSAAVVRGGRPFAWVDGKPVAASLSVGNKGGSVTVVGFGARWRDDQMGGSGDVEPDKSTDKTLPQVYQWEYALVRSIVQGRPLGTSGAAPPPAR
jgi:hypothetical protein